MSSDHDPGYRSERAAMCDGAGHLKVVRYGSYADAPHFVSAVLLFFELDTWLLTVCPDDDTLRIARHEDDGESEFSYSDPPTDSPWAEVCGMTARWVWAMENQEGAVDAIQFSFADDEDADGCRVTMIAGASGWQIED
jgi:Family of unknown function (DUF6334)